MALRLLNSRQLAAQLAASRPILNHHHRHLSDHPAETDNNNKSSSSSSTNNSVDATLNCTTRSIFVNKKVIKQQYVKYSMSAAASPAPSATKTDPYEPHIFPTPNNAVKLQEKKKNPVKKSSSRMAAESRERLSYIKSFYADPEIDKYCEKQFIRLNPMTMMYMGVSNDNSHLLKSANYLRNELPIRLAYMIKELRNLPFIIACNPSLLEIHERCIKTFREFNSFDKEIKDMQSEREFNQIVHNMLELNKDLLVMLCDGFKESRRYIRNEGFIKNNLNKILSARLGIRLLAEHHIALNKQSNLGKIFVSDELNDDYAEDASGRDHDHHSSNSAGESSSGGGSSNSSSSSYGRDESWHGIIHRKFSPKKLIENSTRLVTRLCKEKYGASPKIKIDGHTNAQFPYLPLPLEYIMPELLKNAFRATYEQHQHSTSLPDVNVTIAVNDKDFVIRIRDRGGGIPHELVNRIFDYHFTTAYDAKSEEKTSQQNHSGDDASLDSSSASNTDNSSFNIFLDNSAMGMICEASSTRGLAVMHGYGFGLPTSRAYAEYLGGSLTCQSMQGIGSDFYLRLGLLDVEPEVVRI